jgi:addiction module RelE/StbE family toxin
MACARANWEGEIKKNYGNMCCKCDAMLEYLRRCSMPLLGAWQGGRECHLRPDWLLIDKIDPQQNRIIFERTGSHTDLFG